MTVYDGNWYYLHAEGDGNRGFMHTGWQEIGVKWYYFHKDTGAGAAAFRAGSCLQV